MTAVKVGVGYFVLRFSVVTEKGQARSGNRVADIDTAPVTPQKDAILSFQSRQFKKIAIHWPINMLEAFRASKLSRLKIA